MFRTPLCNSPHISSLKRILFYHSSYPFKPLPVSTSLFIPSPGIMPSTTVSRRPFSPDPAIIDASPLLNFDNDNPSLLDDPDPDHLIFGPIDIEHPPGSSYSHFSWDSFTDFDSPASNNSLFSAPSPALLDSNNHLAFPSHPTLDDNTNDFYLSNWLHESDPPALQLSSSLPIPIPSHPQLSPPFIPFQDRPHFPQDTLYSPTEYAALHSLPRSTSPPKSLDDYKSFHPFDSISPLETCMPTPPTWASQLWAAPSYVHTAATSPPPLRRSPLSDSSSPRQRLTIRRDSFPSHVFQSSSAPSAVHSRPSNLTRTYSRRAESSSVSDDRDATVRRKKRIPTHEEPRTADRVSESRTPFPAILSFYDSR